MAHDNPHMENGICECWCTECHQMEPEIKCVCPKCVCMKPFKLNPAYFRTEEPEKPKERTCENCGDPVIRKGTRGRFPKYCESCRENA